MAVPPAESGGSRRSTYVVTKIFRRWQRLNAAASGREAPYFSAGRLTSYRKCISGQTPHRTQVRNAFRPVIARDIEEWRRAYFRLLEDETGRVPCAISGVLLRPGEGQVDHIHPDTFSSLVDRFLERLGLDYDDVRLRENWDGHIHRPLEDETLGEAFRIWHGEVARLRFIRTDLNRSLGARPQMPEQGSRSNAPAGAA